MGEYKDRKSDKITIEKYAVFKLAYNDPEIGIVWIEVDAPLILSEKDKNWKSLIDTFTYREQSYG